MKTIPLLLCSAPLLLLLAGCATLVSGPDQVLRVTSHPPDAVVSADGLERGTTPIQVCLSRDRDHVVAIDLPGYKHYEILVSRTVNGWFFGNLIFAGPLGMVVDREDGSIYALEPNPINVALEPLGTKRRYGGSPTPDRLVMRPGQTGGN